MKPKRTSKHAIKKDLSLERILTFSGTLRIPVSGSVPVANEVLQIIETQEFQRLRGVRQLGPTYFVYPGAVHTRFEHSLGTYALSLKYAKVLLERDEFYEFAQSPADMVKLLIASALLHDIGHYPFSHLIEEIGQLPGINLKKHEDRADHLIMHTKIREILEKSWGINPRDVCKAIKGQGLPGGFAVMATALSGVLDLDKMDYLIRDSVHCGVNFGLALDIDRFLAGLHIDKANASICLSTKSESHIPTLITVRNLMYNEVYWHKTVRACGAMMKTLIFLLCKMKFLTPMQLKRLMLSQDDQVSHNIYQIIRTIKNPRLHSLLEPFLFRNRALFKMVYRFGVSVSHAKPNASTFFQSILNESHASIDTCLQKANNLEKAIRHVLPTIKQGDILLEYTPVKPGHETFAINSMKLLDERTKDFVVPSYDNEGADNLLDKSRRVFVFCHPNRSDLFKDLTISDWEHIFCEAVNNSKTNFTKPIKRVLT